MKTSEDEIPVVKELDNDPEESKKELSDKTRH